MNKIESFSERENMSQCSLLAGLAISQTRTALCHSMSYPLTAHFGVPHGLACSFTMPIILKHSLQVDDGRLLNLAKKLISKNANKKDLLKLFEKLHEDNDICMKVKEKVKDLDKLLDLIPEMITPGRAENSMLSPNLGTIRKFVKDSWNYKN